MVISECQRLSVCISFRYQVMIDCWQENPSARPTFEGLRDQMQSFERDQQVSFCRPTEYDLQRVIILVVKYSYL